MNKNTTILIIGSLVVILIGVLLFSSISKPGGNQITRISETPSASPTVDRYIYKDASLSLNLSYPSSYTYQNSLTAVKRLGALQGVEFVPKNKANLETELITLTVFNSQTAMTASQWVKRYVSAQEKSSSSGVSSYKYFNASETKDSSISGKPVSVFIQSFPDTEYESYSTVFMSKKYVFVLTHTLGYAEDIYQKMLTSLTY